MKRALIGIAISIAALVLVNFAIKSNAVNQQVSVIQSSQQGQESASIKLSVATFAGGCFWCIESTFRKSGRRRGSGFRVQRRPYRKPNLFPGGSWHKLATPKTVQIHYDPEVISYEALLHYFWRDIDPTDDSGQFCRQGQRVSAGYFFIITRWKSNWR